jgi:hypothetical protein
VAPASIAKTNEPTRIRDTCHVVVRGVSVRLLLFRNLPSTVGQKRCEKYESFVNRIRISRIPQVGHTPELQDFGPNLSICHFSRSSLVSFRLVLLHELHIQLWEETQLKSIVDVEGLKGFFFF